MVSARKDLSYEIYHNVRNSKDIEKLIKKYGTDGIADFEWLMLVNTKAMTTDQIYKYREYLDWEWLCVTYKFTTQFLEKMKSYIHWGAVSCFQNLSLEFIKKHKNNLNLTKVRERLDGNKDSVAIKKYIDKLSKDEKAKEEWEKIICPFFHSKKKVEVKYRKTLSDRIAELDKEEETSKQKQEEIRVSTKTKKSTKSAKKEKVETDRKNKPERQMKKEKTETKKSEPKKTTPKKSKKEKIDYSTLNKTQLKQILSERNIRVYYHDTIPILIKKCQESENDSSKRK